MNNTYNNKEERITASLADWWFAGIIVFTYWLGKQLLEINGEHLEWLIYIFAGGFTILYYLINSINCFFKNTIIQYILSLPFFIFIMLNITATYSNIIFLLGAILIWYSSKYVGVNKIDIKSSIEYILNYWIIFFLASKFPYWTIDFDDFVWVNVPHNSYYYKYVDIIESVTPLIVISIFIGSITLFVMSLNKDKYYKLIFKYWWILPGIIFFMEAFSTAEYFEKYGGSAAFHWQIYIGQIEMMQKGGHLLWDVPSMYGFLNHIIIYLIPVNNAWHKLYILNSILQFIVSFIIFRLVWNKKGIYWYCFSLFFTLAIFYLLPGGQTSSNTAATPSDGPMRFFPVILLMFSVYYFAHKNLSTQLLIALPIWLVGVLWSIESSIFVTVVLGAWFITHIKNKENVLKCLSIYLLYPASFTIAVISILVYYLLKLGHYPDFTMFYEFALSFTSSEKQLMYAPRVINIYGSIWIYIFIYTVILKQDSYDTKYYLPLLFGLWAVISYYISQSHLNTLFNLLPVLFIIYFIFINSYSGEKYSNNLFNVSPLLIMILVISFGNPHVINHFRKTITKQDYLLQHTFNSEKDDYHQILSIINPGNVAVSYTEPGRYLYYNFKNEYIDTKTNQLVKMNDELWLPRNMHIMTTFPTNRASELAQRWISNQKIQQGWYINANQDGWHKPIDDVLSKALKNYQISKRIEYGTLKAVLYVREE